MSIRRLLPLVGIVGGLGLLFSPVLGSIEESRVFQGPTGEISDAECYSHHRAEGFRSMDVVIEPVVVVPRGGVFTINVTIRNPWLHDLRNPSALLKIDGGKGLAFVANSTSTAVSESGVVEGDPRSFRTSSKIVALPPGSTELALALEGTRGPAQNDHYYLAARSPTGKNFFSPDASRNLSSSSPLPPTTSHLRDSLHLNLSNILEGGFGNWTFVVYHRGFSPSPLPYTLRGTIYSNASTSPLLVVSGPPLLKPKEYATFTFTLRSLPEASGTFPIVYGGAGLAFHLHTDPNADDFGNFTQWKTLYVTFGESKVVGSSALLELGPDPSPLLRSYGQVLGFAAAFLLPPSLFLGGAFGVGSLGWLHRTIGPRRRILWHNATSFALLGVALVHMTLLLVESFWPWTTGVLFGGLSLAGIVGLGFSGAFQKRLVALWGYERWRFVHFSLAILVVVSVLAHMLLDGSHWASLRNILGAA